MIKLQFSLYRLNQLEFFELLEDVLQAIPAADAKKLNFDVLYNKVLAIYNSLGEVINPLRKNAITSELVKLDEERDVAYRAFFNIVEIYTKKKDANLQKAALTILPYLETYGKKLAEANYQEETGGLTNLLKDLNGIFELKNAVALIPGLKSWQTDFEVANQNFISNFSKRSKEEGALVNLPKANKVIAQGRESIKKLFNGINALIDFNESDATKLPSYLAVANTVNAVLAKYDKLVNTKNADKNALVNTKTETEDKK